MQSHLSAFPQPANDDRAVTPTRLGAGLGQSLGSGLCDSGLAMNRGLGSGISEGDALSSTGGYRVNPNLATRRTADNVRLPPVSLGDPRTIEGKVNGIVDYSMSAGVRWIGELISYLREAKRDLVGTAGFVRANEGVPEVGEGVARVDELIGELAGVRETLLDSWKWFSSPTDRERGVGEEGQR